MSGVTATVTGEPTVTVTMPMEVAKSLYGLTGNVGGKGPVRNHIQAIGDALYRIVQDGNGVPLWDRFSGSVDAVK